MTSTPQRAQLRSLTSLRFYAALLVVFYHLTRHFEPMEPAGIVFGFGYVGVSFFFMLSGFVIAWSYKDGKSIAHFYWRRFARIWPLHALTTALSVPVTLLMGVSVFWPALPFVLTLTQAWIPPGEWRYSFNGTSWSLACEIFFYCLFPFLLGPIRRQAKLALIVVITFVSMTVIGVAGILVAPERALGYLFYTMPLFRIGEFIIGICIAVAFQRGWRPHFGLGKAILVALASYVILMTGTISTVGDPKELPYVVANICLTPGCMAIIVAAAHRDLDGREGHLHSGLAVRLGYWSFGLYLVHELIIKLAISSVDSLDFGLAVIASVTVIVISVILSGLLYEFFEYPVERRLRPLFAERRQFLLK